MDQLYEFLNHLKQHGLAQGNLLGLLNVLVGRHITTQQGAEVSAGVTWRSLAALLKKLRWDKEAVRELGLDPKQLPPRDRERYWYMAIGLARIDSEAAMKAGDLFAEQLQAAGYAVGPPPRR